MTLPTLRWLLATVAAIAVSTLEPAPAPVFAADAATSRIVGSATYRERIAFPRGAVFEATLEEKSRSDRPGETIASVRDEDPRQVPIPFEIPIDARWLDARRQYVVRASVLIDGRVRFMGTQAYKVPAQDQRYRVTVLMRSVASDDDDRGQGDVDGALGVLPATFVGVLPCADCEGIRYQINLLRDRAYMQSMTHFRNGRDETSYEIDAWSLSPDGRTVTLEGGKDGSSWAVRDRRTLRKLDRAGGRIDSRLAYDVTRRGAFEPMKPRVTLSGMFRYLADAPRFRDCRSGLQWPVAMSNDYRTLERAYTERRGGPGSELLVTLKGRIEQRPKMEGAGVEPTLVVERFVRATPGEDCGGPAPIAGLGNTRWRPVRIGGRPVVVTGQGREPWILLEPRTKRATGFGGCNGISGSYEARDNTLRFGPLIHTQMACPSLDTENAFLRALERTRRYRVLNPRNLELLDDNGQVLARLEERNLR